MSLKKPKKRNQLSSCTGGPHPHQWSSLKSHVVRKENAIILQQASCNMHSGTRLGSLYIYRGMGHSKRGRPKLDQPPSLTLLDLPLLGKHGSTSWHEMEPQKSLKKSGKEISPSEVRGSTPTSMALT